MSKIKPISRKILIKKLAKLGFIGPFSASKHQFMKKGTGKIFIPNPHKKDIDIPLLILIIKQIGIDKDKFIEL